MEDLTNAERSLDHSTRYGVCEPAIDLFTAQRVETERGDGFRIYTARDDVYEALESEGGVETRLHPASTGYRVTVRIPVGDGEETAQEAYQAFRDVADRVETGYDVDLPLSWLNFEDDLGGAPRARARLDEGDRVTVRYRADGKVAIPEKRYSTYSEGMSYVGAFTGGFGLIGADMLGMLSATHPLLPFPAGFGGMVAGGMLGYFGPKTRQWYVNRKRRKRYENPEAVMEQPVLDGVNERNGLERLLDRDEPMPDHVTDRYKELRDEPLDEVWGLLTTAHFERFDRQQGLTASGTFDTYEEAAAFTDVVRGVPQQERTRPSIYEEPAVFENLFSHLVHEVDGELYILDDADVMVGNVVEHGAADGVRMFLDETHADLVQRVGAEHSLSGGGAV